MKSIRITYKPDTEKIILTPEATEESWTDVCGQYDGDVHRVKTHNETPPYNALYECVDDDNNSHYYLVCENDALYREKHKQFLDNLGIK